MSSQQRKTPHTARGGSRRLLLVAVLLIPGVALCLLLAAAWVLLPADHCIARGVSVAGMELGGMTREHARQAIGDTLAHAEERIILSAGTLQRATSLAELGIAPDAETLARQAYLVGRQGTYLSRGFLLLRIRSRELALQPVYMMDNEQAETVLREMAHEVNRPARNASAHWDDAGGTLAVTPGHDGARLDVPASLQIIQQGVVDELEAGRPAPATLALSYGRRAAHITAEALAPVNTILSSFTTAYVSVTDRGSNIKTAAETIDGTVLLPGETFSFNKTVGPRSEKHGFLDAPIIIDGQLKEGPGGGVCQVSTTLYNAVLLADLHVTRRSHHSLPSHYVAAGRDATVSYGQINFRFKNTTAAPIVIEAQPGTHNLRVRILGQGPAPVVHIVTSDRKPQPGRTITRQDPKLPAGTKTVEKGTGGLSITVSRVIGDGPDAKTEVISHDRYSGEPTIIHVGSGAAKSAAVSTAGAQPAEATPEE